MKAVPHAGYGLQYLFPSFRTWTRIAVGRIIAYDKNSFVRAEKMASSDKWFPEGYSPNISTEH